MENYKKTILIDLDGVLNEYNGVFNANEIPPLKNGAKEFLKILSKEYNLKIFTTRNRLLTSKWLIENKIDNLVQDITNVKEISYLHIDDRCICFRGNFKETMKSVKNFKVYWKQ